jgi:hypothetical protein
MWAGRRQEYSTGILPVLLALRLKVDAFSRPRAFEWSGWRSSVAEIEHAG